MDAGLGVVEPGIEMDQKKIRLLASLLEIMLGIQGSYVVPNMHSFCFFSAGSYGMETPFRTWLNLGLK